MTNVTRNRWFPEVSTKCTFCEKEQETTLHILWECDTVGKFWKTLQRWLKHVFGINLNIDKNVIVLNNFSGTDKHLKNTILLLAKHFIYAAKCTGGAMTVKIFARRMYELYKTEEAIALQFENERLHKKKWKKVLNKF